MRTAGSGYAIGYARPYHVVGNFWNGTIDVPCQPRSWGPGVLPKKQCRSSILTTQSQKEKRMMTMTMMSVSSCLKILVKLNKFCAEIEKKRKLKKNIYLRFFLDSRAFSSCLPFLLYSYCKTRHNVNTKFCINLWVNSSPTSICLPLLCSYARTRRRFFPSVPFPHWKHSHSTLQHKLDSVSLFSVWECLLTLSRITLSLSVLRKHVMKWISSLSLTFPDKLIPTENRWLIFFNTLTVSFGLIVVRYRKASFNSA